MKEQKKRIYGLILLFFLLVGVNYIGKTACAATLTQTFDLSAAVKADWYADDGKLVVRGTGAIPDYQNDGTYGLVNINYPYKSIIHSIKNVEIQNGITKIGSYAFDYGDEIITVSIPDSVTEIGDNSFDNCFKIENINIPKNLKIIGKEAFRQCNKVTSFVLPDSVTTIGGGSFMECNSLETMKLSKKIDCIPEWTFRGCLNLKNFDIPEGVTKIEANAFAECFGAFWDNGLTIPDSVTSIGTNSFRNCLFPTLTGGNNVRDIGSSAFLCDTDIDEEYRTFLLDTKSDALITYKNENDYYYNYNGSAWSSDHRVVTYKFRLMSYDGTKVLSMAERKMLLDYYKVPEEYNDYVWFTEAGGTEKADPERRDHALLYGLEAELVNKLIDCDLSDDNNVKTIVTDSLVPASDDEQYRDDDRLILKFIKDILWRKASDDVYNYNSQMEMSGNYRDRITLDEEYFKKWCADNNTFYIAPVDNISRDTLDDTDWYMACFRFESVTVYPMLTKEPSDDSIIRLNIYADSEETDTGDIDTAGDDSKEGEESSEDTASEDGEEKTADSVRFVFTALEHEGVENVTFADFGKLKNWGSDFNSFTDENGVETKFETIKLNVRYGTTIPEPEPDIEEPMPEKSEPQKETVVPVDNGQTDPPKEQDQQTATTDPILDSDIDKSAVKDSVFAPFYLKASVKKRQIKLSWRRIKGADGYIVYGGLCGQKVDKLADIADGRAKAWTQKNLKKGKYYKYVIAAYKNEGGTQKIIAVSKSVHAVTSGGKNGNPTSIKVKKKKYTLKVNKKKKITAKITYKKKVANHVKALRYESSNPLIASVDSKGVVKGKKKGKAVIYIYAQNGIYKKVNVTVK